MHVKRVFVTLFFTLVLAFAGTCKPVFAEQASPELEFLIGNARREINKQEAIVRSLRRRYEDILSRKKALQQFIDAENKKIEESAIAKTPAKAPVKAAPAVKKTAEIKPVEKRKITERGAVLDEVLRQQEKKSLPILKPAPEKKVVVLGESEEQKRAKTKEASLRRQIAEREAQLREKDKKIKLLSAQESTKKCLEEKKKIEMELKKQKAEIEESKRREAARVAAEKNKQAVAATAEKKAKESGLEKKKQELSDKKLEKERLLAEEKEQRLMRERECQMKLLLEADKNAKHERYVSQLGQLLARQNNLLEESRKLESQIHQEEESLKALERTRQELIRKLLENP